MEQEKSLPKAYDAKTVDAKWYKFWLQKDFFKAEATSKKPAYCIVIPPPNITGVLHMGHALVNTLQDVLIRWKRMLGFETLWVPGTDHAGIATQTVVERHLFKTLNKKRTDFSREEFLKHTWQWKEDNEHIILSQLKKLGCSCDWSRTRFTMDARSNLAVRTMFKKLYQEGLIYRGDYLINWDPVSQTALADDEVEYEEKQSFLWHFKYPLKNGNGFVEIATTRPETMLGDTAIAVSPKDPRYTHLIGQFVIQPLTNRSIPIIADNYVDPEFGTGAVKLTPAHDPNDYKMALAHQLPMVNIMTPDGKVNENGNEFQGLTFPEAREAVIKAMKAKDLFIKATPHTLRVGHSYRSKAVIEPYLSKQWFVKMSGFANTLRQLVETKQVKLIPDSWENTYFHWIDNLRDWCISRQLWWGHRIPIWYKKDSDEMICYTGEGMPPEVAKDPDNWEQDHDVLDTWFSSALWPFSTLGWPEKTVDLAKFYPNSTLITGYDILFFWVARMMAMGTHAMGKPPFPETFFHGLIYGKSYWRTAENGGITYISPEERMAYDLGKPTPPDVQFKWEKMSKSKGNVIDPIEIIDEYGTDATRMALCASATQSREIDLDRRRFEEFRNFSNKIWNGARFVLMNLTETDPLLKTDLQKAVSTYQLEDRWILSKLAEVTNEVNRYLENYQFDQAASSAYDFFWKEFCAYYVEFTKPYLFKKTGTEEERKNKQKLLLIILTQAIRLLHPMVPFITEELFQILKSHFDTASSASDPLLKECLHALFAPACAVAPYPQSQTFEWDRNSTYQEFEKVERIVYTIRNLRGEMKLAPGVATDLIVVASSEAPLAKFIHSYSHLLKALVRINNIYFENEVKQQGATGMIDGVKILIPLPQELIQAEKIRLQKEIEKLTLNREKLSNQLENSSFVEKAPPALITKQKEQLKQIEITLKEYLNKIDALK